MAKKFTDQQSGRKFKDSSSSGKYLPKDFIVDLEAAYDLHYYSGGDKIINYSFNDFTGQYNVGVQTDDPLDNIIASPVTQEERVYIGSTLDFIGGKIGVRFVNSSSEDADIRFFADSRKKESTGFATVFNDPVDLVWRRSGKRLKPNDKLTISHEIGHALGLAHVRELSGIKNNKIHKKWGVSDSLMISYELYSKDYNSFASDHQWFTKNDIQYLQETWNSFQIFETTETLA